MSTIEVNKIAPVSGGTAVTMGDSGDTFTVPTGAGLTVTDEVKTNKISPASGTAFTLGDSGDTFTVPSGVTITNSGTATGFGGANTPSFQAQNSSRTTVATNTYTKIAYTTENWDLGGDYDASNSRFTPQTAGKYYVYHSGGFNTGDDFEPLRVAIYKNGSIYKTTNDTFDPSYEAQEISPFIATVIDFNGSSDYVELFARSNVTSGTSTIDIDSLSGAFGAYKIIE
jgi:hypothetical protein